MSPSSSMLVDGGMHAREWVTVGTALSLIGHLVEDFLPLSHLPLPISLFAKNGKYECLIFQGEAIHNGRGLCCTRADWDKLVIN